MNDKTRNAIVAVLKQQGRSDLANHFVPAKKRVVEANIKAWLKAAETLLRGVSSIPGPQGKRLKSMMSDVRSTLEMLDAKKKLG